MRSTPASPPVDAAEATMREELVRVRSELNALYSRLADGKHTGAGTWRDVVRAHEQELEALVKPDRTASHDGLSP